MDDCEHSVILDYFSRKYFNMRDSVEMVDTLSGKTIRVDNDQYIRIQDLILKLDMLFIEDPYKCRILRDVESAIHNKYSKCRKLGEWFDLPEKDLCDIVNNYDFVKYEGR